MSTKVFKVKNEEIKKGFITHDDQEKEGSSFKIVYSDKDNSYVFVSNEKETPMTTWSKRVSGTEITEEQAKLQIQADINAQATKTRVCDMGYTHTEDKVKEWQSILTTINKV